MTRRIRRSDERLAARKVLDAAMTEQELQEAVTELLDLCGWKWMHINDQLYREAVKSARFDALTGAEGFPDVLAIHASGRLLVIEFKTEDASPRPEQVEWLSLWMGVLSGIWELIPARHHNVMLERMLVVVWRPSDWSSGAIEDIVRRDTTP